VGDLRGGLGSILGVRYKVARTSLDGETSIQNQVAT